MHKKLNRRLPGKVKHRLLNACYVTAVCGMVHFVYSIFCGNTLTPMVFAGRDAEL